MPGIEVAVAQIGKKACKAADTRNDERPPGPGVAGTQGKLRQVPIGEANGQQSAAESHAVVKHEVHDSNIRRGCELAGIEAECVNVLRQKVACERLKNRKPAAEHQDEAGD